jgi:hypothetical protein
MDRRILLPLVFAGLAAAAAATPWPAGAQCRLCAERTTVRSDTSETDQVRIDVETSLSFDRLILAGSGEGSASIRPDGSRSVAGSVADMSPRAMVATVVVHGEPGRLVRVDLPRRIDLYALSGGRITFEDVVSDLPSLPKLDRAGNLTFRLGGRLKLSSDADGDYRGDLPITVEYL